MSNPSTPARPSIVNAAINVIIIGFVALMVYLLWPYAVAQWNGAPAQPAQQPALVAPTPAPAPQPAPVVVQPAPVVVQPAPVVVQSVPAGDAPQPVQFQPVIAPAPVVDSAAPVVEPAPRPLIIVHQVSADGAHQVITGSGACKVARVAARCSK